MKGELKTNVSVQVDLSRTIQMLSDRERVQWVNALLETNSEEGTIASIRELVCQARWDDERR